MFFYKIQELSHIVRQQLVPVGWYHSHIDHTLDPTMEDLEFQLKLQTVYPHAVGVIISYGGPSDEPTVCQFL